MKPTPFFLIILLLLPFGSGAQTTVLASPWSDWRYEKGIILPGLPATQFVELTFDEEVFGGAASGLRDIRIVTASDQERPYQLLIEQSTVERAQLSGRILDQFVVPGEYSSFVVDLGESGLFHNQLDIQSSSINFRREVAVEGSNDRAQWVVLQDKGVIYDYTDPQANLKARNTTVRYPESTMRYVRVRVLNRQETPLVILGARIFYEKATQAKTVRYPSRIIEQSLDEEHQASQIIVDLGSTGLPNNRVAIETSDINFQRDVSVEGSNDRTNWHAIQLRDVIFSFQTPKFTGSKLSVAYPENTYRYLRLTVFNQDNPPLVVNGALISGILRKLVFQAQPQESYRLLYGNPSARYPQYDLEQYFKYLETENLSQATLGPHGVNPFFVEKVPLPPPFSERYPWLLPGALALSIGAVGIFLVFLFRSVRKKLPPTP